MNLSILNKLGLTKSQSNSYMALVLYGTLTPAELSQKTGETRTNAYAIIDKLVSLGLASKSTDNLGFTAESPVKIKKLLITRQKELKEIDTELTAALPGLITKFRLSSDKPSTIVLEGKDGIKTLYDDILDNNLPLSVIVSSYEDIDPEISIFAEEQIRKQQATGLPTRVLYDNKTMPDKKQIAQYSNSNLAVKILDIDSPAQILLYENNTAISTFRGGMITTLINHPDITTTMQSMFNALWDKAKDPYNK